MDWFKDWLLEYASAVGLNTPDELRSAALWRDVFKAGKYGEDEVRTAGLAVLANLPALADSPDRFLGKAPMHLAAIQRRLRSGRAAGLSHSQEMPTADERLGVCALCGGTGRVSVPHPKAVVNGQWVQVNGRFYSLAVVCDCALGTWLLYRLDRGKVKFLLLREYHAGNPRWREQLQQHRAEEAATKRATAGRPDESWEELKLRLAGSFGVREPGEEG